MTQKMNISKKQLKEAFKNNLINEELFKEKLFELETQTKVIKRKEQRLPKSLTDEEFTKLIKAIPDKDKISKVSFLLAYESGLRVSEIVGSNELENKIPALTKENFNLDTKPYQIKIYGKYSKERVVPVPKRWKNYMFKIIPINLTARSLQRRFKKYGKKAGISDQYTFHCVSEDTEILTKGGWKNYKDLKKGQKIYSYNLKKDLIEEDCVKKINEFKHKGYLYYINNNYLDILITPNHKLLLNITVRKSGEDISSGWNLFEFEKVLKEIKSKRTVKQKVSADYNGKKSIGVAKAGLLGWILSDGHISKRNKDITISQSLTANKNKCKIIEKLLYESRIESSITIQEKKGFYTNKDSKIMKFRLLKGNNKNNDWVFKFINEDRTPKFSILELKKKELEAVYDNMMLGDGCRGSEYCSQNVKRIEFIQTLGIFLGKRCNRGEGLHNKTGDKKFRTYISNRDSAQIYFSKNGGQIVRKWYEGLVWCPTTNNGTWIARRNKKVFITSNSLRHGFTIRCVERGMQLPYIQYLLGHSNVSTTSLYATSRPINVLKSYEELF